MLTKDEYQEIIDECVANAFDFRSDPRRGAVRIRDLRLILKDYIAKRIKNEKK